ncbi:MAG: class I SAM-dependent methyltransferase [Gallionellaceae bacterium]|nr:class I SAM-dependent methyltransferase [Gallionellaceae bacterium]
MEKILIFPIDLPQSQDFARVARQLGFSVIACSSEPIGKDAFPEYEVASLPYVTDAGFDDAFAYLLSQSKISLVYAPHPAVWWHLKLLQQSVKEMPQFRICNESPYEMDWHSYGGAYQWAESCKARGNFLPEPTLPPLSTSSYAGLYRYYMQIPGQSDDIKLWALTCIARSAPAGDVVEIGSLYGKSAFALSWLAKFHHIGSMIAVDPWEVASIRDQGKQANLLNNATLTRNWQQAFLGFAATVSAFDNVGYIRRPSSLAVELYKKAATEGKLFSEELGEAPVTGKIAILHIDGNHKYESVKEDVKVWLPFVKQGGWILLDDYVWSFGDGPKRAGDELLFSGVMIQTSFVVGDTLYIQKD